MVADPGSVSLVVYSLLTSSMFLVVSAARSQDSPNLSLGMTRIVARTIIITVGFATAWSPIRPTLFGDERKGQEQVIAEITKLGGYGRVDDKRPGRPVIAVDFTGSPCPYLKYVYLLRALPQLEEFSAC